MFFRVFVVVFALILVAHSLPVGPTPITQFGVLQYNYTCDECHRMMAALREHCQDTDTLNSMSPSSSRYFNYTCEEFAWPVSPQRGFLKGKCDEFADFVSKVYCPMDPCVHVTTALNVAPMAVCNLLQCDERKDDQIRIPPPPARPMACPAYVTFITSQCRTFSNTTEYGDFCLKYPANFTREGCNVVFDRLKQVTAPYHPCKVMQFDDINYNASTMCEHVLNLPARSHVPAPEYLTYLALINNTKLVLKEGGITITNATHGRNCKPETADNILESTKAACDRRITCRIARPDTALTVGDKTCDNEMEVFYTCIEGGKLHRVFVPESAEFRVLEIDCSKEVPGYPPLLHSNTPPPPDTESTITCGENKPTKVDFERPEGTFDTPKLQKARDAPTAFLSDPKN